MTKPGSQYSISTQEEMEMDYYDYNVGNASAAPGSYLGMDPAYLVWIPPVDESGKIFSDSENDEVTPIPSDVESGSASGSSTSHEGSTEDVPKVPLKPPRKSLIISDEVKTKIAKLDQAKPSTTEYEKEHVEQKITAAVTATIQMKTDTKRISIIEKETSVMKSPSDNKISEYYELSDIKFADDEDESTEETFTNHTTVSSVKT
jgi:hypothetical protein